MSSAPAVQKVNLEGRLAAHLGRRPGERLAVHHIRGPYYRANWWGPGNRVVRSRFVRVLQMGNDRLAVEDCAPEPPKDATMGA